MSVTPASCPESDVLEGVALGRDATPAVREHLASCPACRAALERKRADNEFLRGFAVGGSFPRAAGAPHATIEIPGYDIVRELHRGGQGVVYLAMQRSTRREVAIKVMRQGPLATVADRARFDREIDSLGKINHPNIVAVRDAGVVSGYQYFVMNYVDGLPLDEAAQRLLNPAADDTAPRSKGDPAPSSKLARARRAPLLDVFIKACDAVHAAHLHGVIHRDLKPSNIYVDRRGEPYVLDFGLAKSIDADQLSDMTQTGQFVGSLPWASPEQVEGAQAKIDLRTDVYSLGAILFQLLTGRLPFDVGSNLRTAVDSILEREPARPSTIAIETGGRAIDDELDTVVLKCLAKDRARRYQSAGELARDLRRYLAGEPIEAKRDSMVYMLRKTLGRYRQRVALATAFVVILGVFGGVMALLYRRSVALEQQALRSAESLATLLCRSNVEQGRLAGMLGNVDQAEQLLWRELLMHRAAREQSPRQLNDPPGPLEPYWALWELYRRYPCLHSVALTPSVPRRLTPSADGRGVWSVGYDGVVQEMDESGRTLDSYRLETPGLRRLPITDAYGRCVLSFDGSHHLLWTRPVGGVAAPTHALPGDPAALGPTAWLSGDGRRAAALTGGEAVVWSTQPFGELARFRGDESPLTAGALSSDGRQFAARDQAGRVSIWDVDTRRRTAVLLGAGSPFETKRFFGDLVFSPDDRWLADAWAEIPGRIWNLAADPPTAVDLAERSADYRSLCFSPDGLRLAIGDIGGMLRIFDSATGQRREALVAHHSRIFGVAFTGDGRGIWTCGADGELRLWETDSSVDVRRVAIDGEVLHSVDVSADGRSLVAGGGIGVLHRISLATGDVINVAFGNTGEVSGVAVAADGRHTAASTYGGAAYVWDTPDLSDRPRRLTHPSLVGDVCFSPDSTRLATTCEDHVVRIWRLADGALERDFGGLADRVPQVAFDPSGRCLAGGLRTGALIVWDVASGAAETWSPATGKPLRAVRYAPDGRWLLTAGADRAIHIWDTAARTCVATLSGHNQEIFCLDISRDGTLVASGDTAGSIRLWRLDQRLALATLDGHTDAVMALRFSPDGRTLVSASLDGSVRVWNLAHHVRHLAGNLDRQLRQLNANEFDPDRAAAWRRWAEDVAAQSAAAAAPSAP